MFASRAVIVKNHTLGTQNIRDMSFASRTGHKAKSSSGGAVVPLRLWVAVCSTSPWHCWGGGRTIPVSTCH